MRIDVDVNELVDEIVRRLSEVPAVTSGAPSGGQPYSPPPEPDDPWGAPPQQSRNTGPAPQIPTCIHGPRRFVPAGTSKKTGRNYAAFWGCAAPQDDPGKCQTIPA